MDRFLRRNKLLKLNQKESNNLQNFKTIKEFKCGFLNLPTKKTPGPYGFMCDFYIIY